MAQRRQFTVVFTCDSAKLGDALAELKGIGVENLGFDLLQSGMQPKHLTEPGAKPTRGAVVMQPRALPAPRGEGSKAQILKNGKNASQTVVDFLTMRGANGATGTEIAAYLKQQGYQGSKGASTVAPSLTYSGRATVDRTVQPGRYFLNPDWKPSKLGGKKAAHVRPDLYNGGTYHSDVTGD